MSIKHRNKTQTLNDVCHMQDPELDSERSVTRGTVVLMTTHNVWVDAAVVRVATGLITVYVVSVIQDQINKL